MTRRAIETDTVTVSQQQHPTSQPFSAGDLDVLFTCLLRFPPFFVEARQQLKPHYFDPALEPHLALLWDVMCDCWDQYGGFTLQMLLHAVQAAMDETPDMITDANRDVLLRCDGNGLIHMAMTIRDASLNLGPGRTVLQRFLHERTVVRPLQRFMTQGYDGHYARDLPEFLDQIRGQQQQISQLTAQPCRPVAPVFGENILTSPSVFHATGIPFIDGNLGGQREGDANGILGVTGGGKSTLGAYLTVSCARIGYIESLQAGGPIPAAVLFTFEEPAQKVEPRLWSAAFQIRRDKLETLTSWDQLTTRNNMEDYELRLRQADGEVMCERERWQTNEAWLNKSLFLYDLSGSGDHPKAGTGYVAEMSSYLDRLVSSGVSLRSVTIDYAGLVCKRYMEANDIPDERLRYYLSRLGDQVRRDIAERFHCTVWLLHQVRADAGTFSPTRLMHHSDSAECKSFAENLSVCGCLGVPDPETGCRRLNWSKVRYRPGDKIEPATLRINDTFAWLDDVGQQYVANESGRGFIDRATANRIEGGARVHVQAGPIAMGDRRGYPDTDVTGM